MPLLMRLYIEPAPCGMVTKSGTQREFHDHRWLGLNSPGSELDAVEERWQRWERLQKLSSISKAPATTVDIA